MKTSLFTLFVCSLIFTLSCNNDHGHVHGDGDHGHQHDSSKLDTNMISQDTFMAWKKAWEDEGTDYLTKVETLTSFTMPIVDFREVLAGKAKGMRFYFGLQKSQGQKELKFMLVGTDGNDKDLIDYKNGHYAYDFSKLCPPHCPN